MENTRLTMALLLLGAGVFVTRGDLVLFQWARSNYMSYLVLGLSLNLVGIFFYAQTLRFESVGVATAAFLGLNIFAVAFAGFLFFGESLNLRGTVGMVLIAFSIFLIEI